MNPFYEDSTMTERIKRIINPAVIIAGLLGLLCFTLALSCSKLVAQEQRIPEEYRVLAKNLVERLHNSYAADRAANMTQEEALVEMRKRVFELDRLNPSDPDTRNVLAQSLLALKDLIQNVEKVKSNTRGWGDEFMDNGIALYEGLLLLGNIPPSQTPGILRERKAQDDAVQTARREILRALEEASTAQRLLPSIAKKYAPNHSQTSALEVSFFERSNGNIFVITNNFGTLRDCTLEVKITGRDGASVTNVHFVEEWSKGSTLGTVYVLGHVGNNTVTLVTNIDINVLSPTLNTTIKYSYNKRDHGKTYQWLLQDVKFVNPQYRPRSPGMLSDWKRSFSTSIIASYSRLPAHKFLVTFRDGNREFASSVDHSGWTDGMITTITPGNDKLTFEPTRIIAEISFPDSTFVIRETFSVDAQGNLRSQGLVRELKQ